MLFGDYNPAGRLTQTWVKSITDLPDFLEYDITKGRTYMYTKNEPLYPFGFGLSYSTFEYSNLKAAKNNISNNEEILISVDIKNTGKILNLVPDLYEAWHAGKSSWKNFKFLNKNSIGIEISNPGHDFNYKRFSKKQIKSIKKPLHKGSKYSGLFFNISL